MAIYHMSSKVLTRSKGHSAIAAAAYRRGIVLTDDRTGIVHDYSRKQGVIYSEIGFPKNAPPWTKDIGELQKTNPDKAIGLLWNSVEKVETRKDSQLVREIEFSLPIELNQEHCIALTQAFVLTLCDKGMVADFSIHWEDGNPHAHILLSMRGLVEEGWDQKERSWNQKLENLEHRKNLAEIINQHLKMAGIDKTVSHLSYIEQGVELEPTLHEGNRKNIVNQQARDRNKKIHLRNLEKIIDNPAILLNKLSGQRAIFSIKDIAKVLGTQLEPANQPVLDPEPPKPRRLSSRLSQVMASVAPQFFQESQIDSAQPMVQAVLTPYFSIPVNTSPQQVVATVLAEITRQESVFNERYLTQALSQHLANPEAVAEVLVQLKASPELLAIGPGEDGRERFTTREMFDFENHLQELAEQLNERANHKISGRTINKYIKKFKLKDDQAKAIRHILKGNDISIMVGRAGTGKSYSLEAAREAWEASGYQVYGVALAGKAADSLENDSGITSRTIESFCYALNEGKLVLTSQDIVVMDEAGMTDSISMSKIMIAVKQAGAKLVLVGDHAQLQPVGPGAIFRAFIERIGFTELTTIRRQVEVWQQQATAHFAAGRTVQALEYYEHHHCISLSDTPQLALQILIKEWADSLNQSPLSENLILAYKNADVNELNRLARQKLVLKGTLIHSITTRNEQGKIYIAYGERLLFLENSWRYGVKNGQLATVIDYHCDAGGNIVSIKVALDGKKKKTIEFNPHHYQKFSHGYAVTVHRAQGATVDNAFVLASKGWNRHLSYVAMTRHRHSAKLYSDKETYQSIDGLKKGMAKIGIKDSTLDYPLAFAARRGIEVGSVSSKFQEHAIEKLKVVKQTLKDKLEQTFHPNQYWARKAREVEIQGILERREDAKLVASYIDAHRAVAMACKELEAYKKALSIEGTTETKEERTLLNNHPASRLLREKVGLRDALAAQIYGEPNRYTYALEIYGIPLEKLEAENQAHAIRLRVARYLVELKQDRTVHRDKIAFIIQQDVKAHYPPLMSSEICLKTLKAHANAHARRDILKSLSVSERDNFRMVESYLEHSQQSGRLWSHIMKAEKTQKISALVAVDDLTLYEIARLQALTKTGTPISRELLMKAREMVRQRDTLAAEIHQNPARYKTALDFYEFGQLKTIRETPSEFETKAAQYAKERLERLQKQANIFISKETDQQFIEDYIHCLNRQNESRYAMAAHLKQDKKRYYRIIFETVKEPLALLMLIGKDDKAHHRNELLKGFSEAEREAFLTVEKYVKEKGMVGQLWHENKNALAPNHPHLLALARPHKLLQDELANLIYQKSDKYQKGLETFKVDWQKLEKNSRRHEIRQRIIHYLTAIKENQIENRNKLATEIVQDIKAHYFILREQKVSLPELKINAKMNKRNEILKAASILEQEAFQTVEHYIQLSQEYGKLWSQMIEEENAQKASDLISIKPIRQMKKNIDPLMVEKFYEDELTPYEMARLKAIAKTGTPLLRENLVKAEEIRQARDSIASLIYQDLEKHKMGLEFYEVGHYAVPGNIPSEYDKKAIQWAKERLVKLEKQAIYFDQKSVRRAVINEYITLLNQQEERRYEIAFLIIQNKKSYNGVIFELSKELNALNKFLYQDAKTHQRNEFLKGLSTAERESFLTVEQYTQEDKTSISLWHETKHTPQPYLSLLKEITTPHRVLRDELADAICAHPALYKNALDFFNIKIENVSKKAFYHHVRNDLAEFKKRVGDLNARMSLAYQMVSNRSAYVVVKEDDTVNWHKLQNYADYFIKIQRIASLSPSEREDYQSVLRYKRLRREAGKLWSELFKQKQEGKDIAEGLFEKAMAVNAERNELAFNIKGERERFDDFLFSGMVQTKDIQKHALAHEKSVKKQKEIEGVQHVQKTLKQSVHPSAQKEKLTVKYWDIEAVNEALVSNVRCFVEHILGDPNQKLSHATNFRYGKKGSLSITLTGHKAGLWYDFQTCEKGNLISLIQRQYQYDFKQALQYAAEWAGIAPETKLLKQKPKVERPFYLKPTEFTQAQLEKIEYANQIFSESVPISGTLAEKYLKEHRGISGPVLDKSFRFNSSVLEPETNKMCPALVVIARNSNHEVQSVHCIYLDPNTAHKMNIKVKKRTYGPLEGGSVLVQEANPISNRGYQFALAEGPETALSVAQSNQDLGVWVTLGVSNFGNVPLPTGSKDILLCADNDGVEADSNKALNKAIDSLSERGLTVYISKPVDCKDFNDVLKKHGDPEVKRLIDTKTLAKEAMTLEQLIEHKNVLISDTAKIMVEFETRRREYEKLGEPESIEAVEKKMILFEQIGKIALFMNDNVILKEAVQRHKIDKAVSSSIRNYVQHQKWSSEAKTLMEKMKTQDPLKDYVEAIEQKDKLTLPWQTNSKSEKDHWNRLNNKIQQLAFIIDKNSSYQYFAKEMGIYEKVKRHSFEWQDAIEKKLSLELGIGIGL